MVETVNLPDEVSHYIAHLGFLPGARVDVLRRAPAGDPTVFRLDGVEVALRSDTARHILMAPGSGAKPVAGTTSDARTSGVKEIKA